MANDDISDVITIWIDQIGINVGSDPFLDNVLYYDFPSVRMVLDAFNEGFRHSLFGISPSKDIILDRILARMIEEIKRTIYNIVLNNDCLAWSGSYISNPISIAC